MDDNGSAPKASEFAGIGLQFAISVVLFVFVGEWLDSRLGTAPWLLILGAFLGAGASFYNMYRKLAAFGKRDDSGKPGSDDR